MKMKQQSEDYSLVSSKFSLEAVTIAQWEQISLCSRAYATNMKENYESMKILFEKSV